MAIHSSDRDAWLLARQQYICASEIAAVLGENEYMTREQIIQEKIGMAQPFEGNERTENALALEAWVAQRAAEKWGWKLTAHGALVPDPDCEFLAATPDFVNEAGEPVQVKVTSVKPYEEVKKYGGAPPLNYQLQVMAEMACLGAPRGFLLVFHTLPLIVRSYPIERHEGVISRIRREAETAMLEVRSKRAEIEALMSKEERVA
jgi:putative phage-type endonuclease